MSMFNVQCSKFNGHRSEFTVQSSEFGASGSCRRHQETGSWGQRAMSAGASGEGCARRSSCAMTDAPQIGITARNPKPETRNPKPVPVFNFADRPGWLDRRRMASGIDPTVAETVRGIIADVRADGDDALRRLTHRFDGVWVDQFRVSEVEIRAAYHDVDQAFVDALRSSIEAVRHFHGARAALGKSRRDYSWRQGLALCGVHSSAWACMFPAGARAIPPRW